MPSDRTVTDRKGNNNYYSSERPINDKNGN